MPELNQCDGCRTGWPVVDGIHRNPNRDGYPNDICCTADRYPGVPPVRDETRNAIVEGMWRCQFGHYNLASPDVCAYCDVPREPKMHDLCGNCEQPYENHGVREETGATCPDRSGQGFEFATPLVPSEAGGLEEIEAAYRRQSERVHGRKEGEYGPYTNADWQDVNILYRAARLTSRSSGDGAAITTAATRLVQSGREPRNGQIKVDAAAFNALQVVLYAAARLSPPCEGAPPKDTQRLDYLDEVGVETILLRDGTQIGPGSLNVRAAIDLHHQEAIQDALD